MQAIVSLLQHTVVIPETRETFLSQTTDTRDELNVSLPTKFRETSSKYLFQTILITNMEHGIIERKLTLSKIVPFGLERHLMVLWISQLVPITHP